MLHHTFQSTRFTPAKRALVIGGSGQVGGALVAELSARGHEVVATWRSVEQSGLIHCDLGDAAEVERVVAEVRADWIFCPAGATWVDGCEKDPEWAQAANCDGPLAAARAAFTAMASLGHRSGRRGPCATRSRGNDRFLGHKMLVLKLLQRISSRIAATEYFSHPIQEIILNLNI